MNEFLLFAVLALNVLISIWNCFAVGSAWKDTMAMGGWFNKVVLWSAVIQSGVGFSMPILIGLTYGTVTFLTSGEEPSLSPEEAQQLIKWVSSLWYVAVIFPILGSGLSIWAHSLRVAYQRRDFASIATAGWNSYAQISNTMSAMRNFGFAFSDVSDMFSAITGGLSSGNSDSDSDNKNGKAGLFKLAILVIILVVTSLLAGFMIAIALVRYFANQTQSRLEEYGEKQFA